MASKEVADLVRKAWKSIIDDPKSWNQDTWISHDSEGCGTTFCLGGWMMVHHGLTVAQDLDDPERIWFEDELGRKVVIDSFIDPWITDIHGEELSDPSVFNVIYDTLPKLHAAIEAAGIVLDPVEPEHPAGRTDWDLQFHKDIEFFVELCAKAGDPINVDQVLRDDLLMVLLRTIRRNGRREGKAEVPANEGVLEAQHLLKLEQRHSEKLREDLDREKAMTSEYIRQRDDALRALRDENEDLRLKASASPAVRVETLQRALRERTRQAREAGAAAREARIQVQAKSEAIERLQAILDGQEGMKALQALLDDANRKVEILKIRMSLIHNYSEIGGL